MNDYMNDFSWGKTLALGCIFLGAMFFIGFIF